MFRSLSRHIKSNEGSQYIQMLISLPIFLFIIVLLFQMASVFSMRLKIDGEVESIARKVSLVGDIDDDVIVNAVNDLHDEYGGLIEINAYAPDDDVNPRDISADGIVPRDDRIEVAYIIDDYPIIRIGDFIIPVDIHITKNTICQKQFTE